MTPFVVLFLASLASIEPRILALETPASVWDVAAHDLNGDKKQDILAFCADPGNGSQDKYIAVFLAGAQGAYTPQPTFTLPLDPSCGSVFLAEVDGEPPAELVATRSDGAEVFRFSENRFTYVAGHRFISLLPGGVRQPVFLEHAAMDLDGNGTDEWFVPVPSGYAIREPGGRVCNVECDIWSEIESGSSMHISHRFPEYHAFALPGQERKGLAFLTEEFVDFAYGPDWTKHQRYEIPTDREEGWAVKTFMDDMDGNGLPDLIVMESRGNVQVDVRVRVYLASAPLTFSDNPSATFACKGAFATPLLVDVNGDGKTDIVSIRAPFGLRFFINYFLRKKLSIQAEVHLLGDDGFGTAPDHATMVSVDAPADRRKVAYIMGDFNGDRRVDVAFGAGSDALVIHTGEADRFLSSKRWLSLALPAHGDGRPFNLNGNTSDDIIIFHPGEEYGNRIEVILF